MQNDLRRIRDLNWWQVAIEITLRVCRHGDIVVLHVARPSIGPSAAAVSQMLIKAVGQVVDASVINHLMCGTRFSLSLPARSNLADPNFISFEFTRGIHVQNVHGTC